MSFLYPNTISILRPVQNTAFGAQDYGGISQSNMQVIASEIPAHIQLDRQGTSPTANLPGDAAGQAIWKIIFKGAKGLASSRDFITDELGQTYQIIAADWGPLSTTCRCQIMET